MSQSLHPMLNIAIKAARAAGAIINRGSQDLDILKITRKGPNDLVSEIDHLAEAAIIETLLGAYPGHGILAEESGRSHGAQNSEFVWIIDPLDGTINFLHGLPIYAVSIALAWRGVVQQAVVYDPCRNDLFYASRGRGAFLNDKRLRVSKRIRLSDAMVGTGFPFRKGDNLHRYLTMLETVMGACGAVRRPGSAALDLCYVAAGWYDGFFETGLSPWDIAAGSLMITEAGGLVGNFTGDADFLYQREVVAGNPKIYGQLVPLLTPFSKAIKGDEATDAAPAAAVGDSSDSLAALMATGLAAQAAAEAPAASPVEATAAPAERERKPVRIRKVEAPAGDAPVADRGYRGRPETAAERAMGPRNDGERPRASGRPAPGRPLPTKR